MPTYLKLKRTTQEDLAAIRTYVDNQSDGWEDIKRVLPQATKRFAQYSSRYFEPGGLVLEPSDRISAQAMHALYDSKAKHMRYKSAPRKPGYVGCCPYCGIKGSITVDHYLPRGKAYFPHFSVLSANLLPACGDCQGHKLSYYPPPMGRVVRSRPKQRSAHAGELPYRFRTSERRILHPYFDRFLEDRVLIAQIEMDARGTPSLTSIVPRLNLPRSARHSIEFHLKRLDVLERAKGEVDHLHGSILKGLKGVNSPVELIAGLRTQLASAQSRGKSLNFFDALYLHALIVRKDLHPQLLQAVTAPSPELERIAKARRVRVAPARGRRQPGGQGRR